MDTGVLIAVLSLAGVVFSALLLFAGTKVTQRATANAAKRTAAIEQTKVEADAYTRALPIWDELIGDLRQQVADQRAEMAEMRTDLRTYKHEVSQLTSRLQELEDNSAADRRALQRLLDYARELVKLLRAHGIALPPDPPEGLDLDPLPPS